MGNSKISTVLGLGLGAVVLFVTVASTPLTRNAAAAPAFAPAAPAAAALPRVKFAQYTQTVLEEGGSTTILVQLSSPSRVDVTVPYTLSGTTTELEDFLIDPSPLVIPAFATSAVINIVLLDDDDYEADQSLIVTMGTPINATIANVNDGVHTIAIHETALGDPIEGLTPELDEAFERGRAVFNRRFTPSEGLGPFYNATSCQSCHSTPVPGGGSNLYRNFFLAVYYEFTPTNQSSSIPPFLSQVVPAFGSGATHPSATFTLEGGRPLIPDTVFGLPVIASQRNAIPMFGTGLFELISNSAILANQDINDSNGDGISGRSNTQLNGAALGRFGTKAQVNNVELFTRGPLQNQMGITSNPVLGSGGIVSWSCSSMQVSANPNDPTIDNDGVPDPEISTQDLTDLITFTKFIAPPLKQPFGPPERRGELLFDQMGCAKCHVPSLPSSIGPVNCFSDLLLHDMGTELVDNIKLGDSLFSVTEHRTQPLWGISLVGPFLHDGRAATLTQAIEAHRGEALPAREAFIGLSPGNKADLISYLEHL